MLPSLPRGKYVFKINNKNNRITLIELSIFHYMCNFASISSLLLWTCINPLIFHFHLHFHLVFALIKWKKILFLEVSRNTMIKIMFFYNCVENFRGTYWAIYWKFEIIDIWTLICISPIVCKVKIYWLYLNKLCVSALFINPLSANPTTWSNTLKQIADELFECLWPFCEIGT